MRANRAVNEQFDDGLDICKLVETTTSLNLLVQTLLTKPAQFLFYNHRDRVVSTSQKRKKYKLNATGGPSTSSSSDEQSEDDVKSLMALSKFD